MAPMSIHRTILVAGVLLLALLAGFPTSLSAAAPSTQNVATPPPVSGRRLSDPASILPADVLARVELLRANTELLRLYMGRSESPDALLRVESAQPREVYSQALNLQLRANRLAFEQVRVVRSESIPMQQIARPAEVFGVVDSALAAVLLVKQSLGIAATVAENVHPESTTPSEVFNATVAAGSEINHLLAEKASPSDVFQLVTAAVHTAAALHATIPKGPTLPAEPAFEANKMSWDVFLRLQECFSLIRDVAARVEMKMLRFELADVPETRVTPNDVSDLAALVVEELGQLSREFPDARTPVRAYHPGKRFPSHVFQRAGLLQLLLRDLVEAHRREGVAPPRGR